MQKRFAALICAGLVGCASNPFPKDSWAFVRPGQTTRAEIIENFSTPSLELKNERVIAYIRDKIRGHTPYDGLAVDLNSTTAPTVPSETARETSILCFQLDDKDRVVRAQNIVASTREAPDEVIRKWARGEKIKY